MGDAGHLERAMQSATAQPEAGGAPASVTPSLRRRQSWTYADNRQTPAAAEEEGRVPTGQSLLLYTIDIALLNLS